MQTTRLGISLSCGLFGLILWVACGNTLCGATTPRAVAPGQTPSRRLLPIQQDSKWGYIDKSGKFVIQPQYRDAGRFSEGLAPINSEPSLMATDQTGVGTGYIDKTGTLIIARPFGNATSFVNGIAKVYEHGKMGYINKKGNYIWKPTR